MDSVLWSLLLMGSVLVVTAKGVILCDCTTEECREEGQDTCYAAHFCYSEYFKDTLTRGCIDDRSSLLCENHKPKGIDYWPSLFCCNDRNFCNKDAKPTLPSESETEKSVEAEPYVPPGTKGHHDPDDHPVRCPETVGDDGNSGRRSNNNNSSNKVINPIYIAVPVAGVCVLLALVIFALYLLRRRNHHYDNYHHYHDHLAGVRPYGHKQPGAETGLGTGSGGGGGGMPLYHHQQHCDCICKKTLPPCGGKVNRCTDSERSSSGSETKLFLQA